MGAPAAAPPTLVQHGGHREVHLPADCGKRLRIGLVASRFNGPLVECLVQGATEVLDRYGVPAAGRTLLWVPGAFELPWAAGQLAGSGAWDALICLGAVVRGDTPHFDFVCAQAAAGIMQAGLAAQVPILFGVLTCNTLAQAEARCGKRGPNRGGEWALSALEMALLRQQLGGRKGSN